MTLKPSLLYLPVGFTDEGGTLHRDVEPCPLTGKAEEQLAQHSDLDGAPAFDVVLVFCLGRVGTLTPVPPAVVAGLSETDRFYLALELQGWIFGDRVRDRVSCPGSGCGETVDIDFSIRRLISGGIFEGEVGAALDLEVHCPECGEVFGFPFHPPGFFIRRLRASLPLLYEDVHTLASHYHWSEAEILSLPREKRLMYLEIIAARRLESLDEGDLVSSGTGNGMEAPREGRVSPGSGESFTGRAARGASLRGPGDFPPGMHPEPGPVDNEGNRGYSPDRPDKPNKTGNGGNVSPPAGEPPDERTVMEHCDPGFTEVTEIQLPGSVEPPTGGGYNTGEHEADDAGARPPDDTAAAGPPGTVGESLDAASPPGQGPPHAGPGPPEEDEEPPPEPRETPEITGPPVYTDDRPQVPSAFWARSYLGRFHLRTLR